MGSALPRQTTGAAGNGFLKIGRICFGDKALAANPSLDWIIGNAGRITL